MGLVGVALAGLFGLTGTLLSFFLSQGPQGAPIKLSRFHLASTSQCIRTMRMQTGALPKEDFIFIDREIDRFTMDPDAEQGGENLSECEESFPLIGANLKVDVVISNFSGRHIVIDAVDVIRRSAEPICGGGAGLPAQNGPMETRAEVKISLPSSTEAPLDPTLPSWLGDEFAEMAAGVCWPFTYVRTVLDSPLQVQSDSALRFSLEVANGGDPEFLGSYFKMRFKFGDAEYLERDFIFDTLPPDYFDPEPSG
jgi:hypothetical protein